MDVNVLLLCVVMGDVGLLLMLFVIVVLLGVCFWILFEIGGYVDGCVGGVGEYGMLLLFVMFGYYVFDIGE